MEKVELPIHTHPLLPITRFSRDLCNVCDVEHYIYGGYRCNELGCQAVFHRECAESLPEINHSSHPDHPLQLFQSGEPSPCSRCGERSKDGYICSICNFKLDLHCAKGSGPLLILENSNLHEHPLELLESLEGLKGECRCCHSTSPDGTLGYGCKQCDIIFHAECADFFPEANHTSHPQHPLKLLTFEAPALDNGNEKCLLCGIEFYYNNYKFHHCDVCNFNICRPCMKNPPPVVVESPKTHEHELHLVPRRINFTCNACGMRGDRSPYFCLQCNFMIHRECIDLPRVININRHNHRTSYTRRLGHRKWKCKVCREEVDGFYGAYICVNECNSFVVHSLCATRKDVWDMVELEGIPDEEEELAPFEKIDANTIKHFSHNHNLHNDGHGRRPPLENIVCEACLLQILTEPFYSCKQCHFFLHDECANLPRKKRHVHSNQPFTLLTCSLDKIDICGICENKFTGFRYKAGLSTIIDVRCAAISDTLDHKSHQHSLYFYSATHKRCSRCNGKSDYVYRCDECDYTLDRKCTRFPNEVMKNRYDDHPLFLSFGDMDVDGGYWCEACETKVKPKEWFYTCNDCGTILHTFCVVGDLSFIKPGSVGPVGELVVSNTSVFRPLCSGQCKSRCKLPSILKISRKGHDVYACSFVCSSS